MLSTYSEEITSLAEAKLTLLRGSSVRLYRAEKSGVSVLAAVPASRETSGALTQLRYEYDIRAELKLGFALRPVRFITHDDSPAMLLQDPCGEMLSNLLDVTMPVHQVLNLAVGISLALASAHARNLVHGGLTPGSIMIHPGRRRAWLTGFRSLTIDARNVSAVDGSVSHLEPDLLHYIAPEATGRVNRPVDCRTDLYSLGCILYLLLTGRVPFPGLAPAEEIHAHIARWPPEHVEPSGAVAQRLVAILFRLMAKEPEERYQLAADVVADLLTCDAKGGSNGSSTRILHAKSLLGTSDVLLGRDGELESLRKAVHEASIGESARMIPLEGPAGIGKTALIQHLRKQLREVPHEFAMGKCEQAEGATPYASLTRALRYWQRGILGCPPHEFKLIQTRIKDALADDASIISAVFPSFTPLLGVFEHCRAVSIHAERPRFLKAMVKLFGALATRGRPLIMVLDDLQWVDEGTLEVLAYAMRHSSNRCVLFLGAIRSGEMQLGNAWGLAFPNDDCLRRLSLTSLPQDDVKRLLKSLLAGDIAGIDDLAASVHARTGGNPLFVIQLLRSLIDENVVDYDDAAREWRANLTEVADKRSASSVVKLLEGKLHSFMPDAIDVLRCLAVLAGPASAKALADAMQLSETNIRIRLCDAMDSQFVWTEDGRFTFSHDRFREAVLNGMTYRERLEGHLRVGRNLLESSANDELSVGAFAIVQQLNMAMPVVDGPDERRRIALLNLEAARLAKEATAYASARSYLSCARMFAQDADQRETIGALIELRLGECEFLTMEMSRAENRLSRLRVDLLNHKNKAELARLRVALHVALDQPKLALQVGLRYLAEETGIVLPLSPTDEEVDAEYLEFRTLYSDRSINDLVAAPLNQDENVRYAMDVLADLKPAALFTDLNLKDTVVLRMSSLSLKFGNCDASCYAYVCLSLVVGARYGDYRTASQFGELAMRLSPERGLSRFQGRVQMCYGTLNLPWTGPATVARQHIRESIRLTTQQGDLTFAIYSRRHLATNLLFCGAPLSDAQSTVEEGLVLARQANFAIVIDAFVAQAWFINAMRGAPVDLGISEDCPDYAALLENSLGGKFYRDIAAFAFWTYQLQVAYNFRDFETALRAEENANRIAWSSRSFLEIAEFNFYSALLRLAMARHSTVEEKEVHLRIANDRLSIVTKWSSNCPSNFLSREKLIQGELAYVENRILDAQSLYEAAIQLSTESDALHLQGLSCELAAHFCAAQRWHTAEQGYMKRAWNAYACWGADSMLRRIEQKFAYLKPTAETAVTPEHLVRGYQFDARAMLRAAQALSSEISLARLIHVLLENVQQYAGADRAVLCLLMDGILTVAAQATYSRSTADVRMERGVASPEILPTAIAYFTLRTQESLVLRDAREDPHYGVDVYIIERQPRSILCVPLVKQGKLLGLLYMENSLIAGIFTVDNVQMLEVLASQAAISLENVRLYEDLQTENLMRAATESNLRETQERLDKVAKLTAMGELVASIVHEVSQPLSAIGTCSRAALRWLNRETPDIGEVRGMLDQISADSMRAANIVTSLRAMTKRTAPRLDTLDVNEAIREVLGLVRGQLRNGGIVVRGNFDSGSLNVRGDRILLQQVLMNLVVNACEAMSDTGQREKVIEIKTRMDEENTLWVAVSDTGHGIAAESAPALFDSFFTTKDSGMGMGLSICKSIVEAHGGSIEAVSDVLGGACFQFSVPQSAGN
ncbi:Predicted ATPase [Paraburkholderia phenazinium]|uniref:histidine kinase n=2 Tax=Burkholderiaceae TaxID=119060 RepID=A0A1N6KCH3_9BURK|nr:Predicted ATPase [Paraburkholderia phenazinium]